MKKHLIAAAVAAAFAVPAIAQNVSISGTLDVQATNDSKVTRGANTTSGSGSGGQSLDTSEDGFATSQLVLTMTEDLGGGLKATGYFAQRLTNTLGARDRYIDLAGGFGGLRVGRFNPAVTSNFLSFSGLASTGNAGSFYNFVTDGANLSGTEGAAVDGNNNAVNTEFSEGSHERDDGTIQFTSPNMNGFVATVGYRKTSTDRSANAGKGETSQTFGSLAYSAGPLTLGYGHSKRRVTREETVDIASTTLETGTDGETIVTTGVGVRETKGTINWVGGGYNFGFASVNLMFANRDIDRDAAKRNDAEIRAISLTIPVGAVTLSGSYYSGSDKGAAANNDDVDTDGYQISARYALSKRTYAYLINGTNKIKTAAGNVTANDNRKFEQTGLGLVHTF